VGEELFPENGERAGRALGVAYRYLNRRERSESELREHLTGRGFDSPTVDAALEVLRGQGYVDDARFARMLAQDKRSLEQWGSERIERALLARGIDRGLIADAVSEEPAGAEADRALELLQRRFRSPPADARERERALGVLLRKGFDSELAIEAVASYARGAR
jgi:regulatory protein